MDDLETLKAEVCRLLDSYNFWQAIQIIQNAMMDCNFSPCKSDVEEEGRHSGLLD